MSFIAQTPTTILPPVDCSLSYYIPTFIYAPLKNHKFVLHKIFNLFLHFRLAVLHCTACVWSGGARRLDISRSIFRALFPRDSKKLVLMARQHG
jgi:hypothetical protein